MDRLDVVEERVEAFHAVDEVAVHERTEWQTPLRPAAAADKTDQFPTKRPPQADSFTRWLGGTQ